MLRGKPEEGRDREREREKEMRGNKMGRKERRKSKQRERTEGRLTRRKMEMMNFEVWTEGDGEMMQRSKGEK